MRGPLLVTGFANRATPLLRYRVGDVGTRSKHPCPCGRAGDVFVEVDGRVEDYVQTPDGRLVGRLKQSAAPADQIDLAVRNILSRMPDDEDIRILGVFLEQRSDRPDEACRQLVWALLTCSEFRFNH